MSRILYENMLAKSNMYLNSMLSSKIITGIYSMTRNSITSMYDFIRNLPTWYKAKIVELKNCLDDFKYRLQNLGPTNIELGIYHIHQNNLNDAIIRFKLVDKFFNPNDTVANYWLGWTYFLKNNYQAAVGHLQKAKNDDLVDLGNFLTNYSSYSEIPIKIWHQYRELTAEYYIHNFTSSTINLPYSFVQKALNKITDLPDNYSILELGSNVGMVGYEIRKRFPDGVTLVGVEDSNRMATLVELYYPNEVYDQLIISSVPTFLTKASEEANKFDIIFSFCGLTFTNNLKDYFGLVYSLLQSSGYFAICLPMSAKTTLSLNRKEFIFAAEEVIENLEKTGFSEITHSEISLVKNNKYSIIICKKSLS